MDPRVTDGVVAGVLLLLQVAAVAGKAPETGQRAGDWLAYVLSVGLCVPYAVHRRRPMLAMAVVAASLVLYSVRQYAAYPGLSLFVLVFAIALHSTRRQALHGVAGGAGALAVALAVQPAGVATPATWTSTLLATAVAWLAGENMRNRRARIALWRNGRRGWSASARSGPPRPSPRSGCGSRASCTTWSRTR